MFGYSAPYINRQYRDDHNAQEHHAARHAVPQQWLNVDNLPHHYHNLRLGSHNPRNVPIDRFIDDQTGSGNFNPGYTSTGHYVSNQMAVDRIQQQLNSYRVMEEEGYHVPRIRYRSLYHAADDAGMDLRAFNGIPFYRS